MDFKISLDELKAGVDFSLQLLCANDGFLLQHDAHERSITHKMGEYLQQWFSDFEVDCEYSKHGLIAKRLPRNCDNKDKDLVYPDIVIHLRGVDTTNLLVIEAKLGWDGTVPQCDLAKLVNFTDASGGYNYDYGLFVAFNGANPFKLVWFSNSQEIERCSYANISPSSSALGVRNS